jgi:stage V sporulation protein B
LSLSKAVFSLFMAGLFSKLIGVLYRVPLSYILGAEGIGLYQMAYPAFIVVAILAGGGLPLAMAKFIAEHKAVGHNDRACLVFKVGRGLLGLQGIMLSITFYLLAPTVAAKVLGDPRTESALKALAPAVFLICIEGSLRGYFQGQQKHVVLAKAQVFEQICRVGTMLALALFLLPYGLEYAAAGAAAGAAGGALGAVVFLRFYMKADKVITERTSCRDYYRMTVALRRFALPVMLGSFIMPVMQMVDAAIVPLRLQAGGIPMREATALFGQHAGMALSLVGLPTVVTGALATALVPEMAGAKARDDQTRVRGRIHQALKLTMVIAVPAAVGLYALAEEVCQILFDTPTAAIPLRWLAFGTVGLCLMETNSALLHALNKGRWAVAAIFTGGVVNALIDYYLCAIPIINIRGAALGTGIGFTVAALLSLLPLKLTMPGFWPQGMLLWPLLASLPMLPATRWILAQALTRSWPKSAALLAAIGTGVVVYGCLARILGLLDSRTLRVPPHWHL